MPGDHRHPPARHTGGCHCLDRRQLLRGGLVAAGGAAALTLAGWPLRARAGEAQALVLCCMDFRLIDDVVRYFDGRGLTNNYDQVILAGASLGAMNDQFPDWGETFQQHVRISKDLHHIHEVILLDHRDCGAYKVILGEDFAKDPARETAVHAAQLHKVDAALRSDYPDLHVEMLLMSLDGSVETIS